MTSKVKGQGHKLTSSVRLISASSQFGKQNAVPVSRGGWGHTVSAEPGATLLVLLSIIASRYRLSHFLVSRGRILTHDIISLKPTDASFRLLFFVCV